MNTIGKASILSVVAIILISCSTFTPKPTETPAPTATSLPTSTNTPQPTSTSTKTPIPPTVTPIPFTETPSAPALPMPSGEPLSEWEGIPVMPGALAGEGDSQGYSFVINTTTDEIQTFYSVELAKHGWNMFASGQGGSTDTVMLIFMKDSSTFSVTIIPQPDGSTYVLLVK